MKGGEFYDLPLSPLWEEFYVLPPLPSVGEGRGEGVRQS